MSDADAFFEELDGKVAESEEEKIQRDAEYEKQRELVRRVLKEEIEPLLLGYVDRLKSRGWKVEFELTDATFALTLFYKDGCRNQLALGDDGRACRLVDHSANDDHKSYSYCVTRSGSQTPFNPFDDKWSIEWFEKDALQRFVEHHRFYADRHTGIRTG